METNMITRRRVLQLALFAPLAGLLPKRALAYSEFTMTPHPWLKGLVMYTHDARFNFIGGDLDGLTLTAGKSTPATSGGILEVRLFCYQGGGIHWYFERYEVNTENEAHYIGRRT